MLELRVLKGPSAIGQKFPLATGQQFVLGRDPACDIRLSSNGVSKKHCRVTVLPGSKLEVEDLKSSNGTFVNGVMIKKHVLQPGDSLNVHEYTLQVAVRVPDVTPDLKADMNFSSGSGSLQSARGPSLDLATTVKNWLSNNVYPLADSLSMKFDLRMLIGMFFLIWSVLIILLTATPFSGKANVRMRDQSAEVARLYGRQLARLNQQAIIDQRYRDLIAELDARRGQTPGLISSMILDSTSSQVLAPAEFFGQSLPSTYAAAAINHDEEFVQYDSDGIAYASVPIKIGGADGKNKTSATAFVVFDTNGGRITFADLLQQVVDSLLKALLISVLVMVFVYRWLEGSLETVVQKVDRALKNSENTVTTEVRWPILRNLCEQISNILGRANQAPGADASGLGGASEDWAIAATANTSQAAAAFNSSLTVIAWNSAMEQLIGIRANLALGADIGGASRDVAFESTIRDLAAQSAGMPWTTATKDIEFGGIRHMISMVYGSNAHLVNITRLED